MTKLRLSGTIGPGIVLIATCAGYAFFQPFIPNAVQQAIPEQATFIHQADSLDDLLQSPVCGQLDKALGAGNSLAALLGSNPWIKLAAPSEIAVADIPFHYAGQSKSWAAVTWVGWRSPWLRWKLERTRADGFSFLGKHAVWPVWQYDNPGIARGCTLTFALTDNLFIACLSENPSHILLLLDTYDKRAPSINDAK
ncbi:MAG: hypothetical protein K9M54_10120 [Kiritimatiellales bacterium]|nr:hypothetical protein [Kiritimatiellales bacterium]